MTFFAKGVRDFLASLASRGYAANTLKVYRSDLRTFAVFVDKGGYQSWFEINRSELIDYAQSLMLPRPSKRRGETKPWSANTRNRHLTTIRTFFSFLVKSGVLLSNPAAELEGFRWEVKLPKTPSSQEVLKLLAACDISTTLGLRDRCMFELFYSCAPRLSELLNLDLTDLCFLEKTIRIRCGKYGKDRILPMLTEAEHLLLLYLKQARSKLRGVKEQKALFLSSLGNRLSANTLWHIFGKYNQKAGLKTCVSAHTLRHCCATHLLKENVSLRHIQVLLGHQSLSTTQVYTKVEISDLQQVIRRHHPRETFR